MKNLYFFTFYFLSSLCFAQNLDWFYTAFKDKAIYNSYQNMPSSLAVDDDENIYIVGAFGGKIGFDEKNPLNFQLDAQSYDSLSQSCYIAKIDKNKNYLWSKTISFTGNGSSKITSITIDNDENVIVVGTVEGQNINLNPGSSSPVLYNTSYPMQSAIFVNKYSKNGDFIFGHFYLGGSGAPKVATDSQGDIIVTGSYYHYQGLNTDFDLTDQVYYLEGQFGFYGASFILKTNKTGDFKWAKYVQGHNSAYIHGVKIDSYDNIVFKGNNEAYFNFNGEHTSSNISISNEDYIAKVDKSGNLVWRQVLGGRTSYDFFYDCYAFDIDTDNSIVLTTSQITAPVPFPNATLFIPNTNYRGLLIKIDENRNYLWHASMDDEDYSQSHFPLTVSINSDHTINWTTQGHGIHYIYDKNENREEIRGQLYRHSYPSSNFSFLFKFNVDGKLIYNKYKLTDHHIARADKTKDKLYYAGRMPGPDKNPDQNIIDPPNFYQGDIRIGETFLQKLDKCYSGTPDGDPFFYTCISEVKKIKDLHPKTSYSSWYDSPTSTTPLSPETVLETKQYYAETQDVSCPHNSTRLEVDVRVFQNPPKPVVSDFSFCNLNGKRLYDLKINNNVDVEFFDENLISISSSTTIQANKKYYVRVIKTYYPYISCRSDFAGFYVYDTSVAPMITANQSFCKKNEPRISDLLVTGVNLKWYDSTGKILPETTFLQNQTKYYVTQTSGTCESAKAEIVAVVNDTLPPTGNTAQDFCTTQNATLQNIQVSGVGIKWYDEFGSSLNPSTSLVDGKTYYATQTVNACESTQKLGIKVSISANSLPANDYSEIFCDENTDDQKSIELNDYRAKLIADFQNYNFEFYDQNNQPMSGMVIIPLGLTVYDVKITSFLGCYKWVELSLTLQPKPKLNLPEAIEFCEGQSAILDAGNGYSSYLWNTGEKTQSISTNREGNYSVTVTNSFGCLNIGNITVKKSISATIKNILIVNNNVTMIISEPGDYLFSLDNISFQTSNTFSNLQNGTYTVFVKTNLGCIIGVQTFTIFSVPNSFTPNADGFNDFWMISGLENYANSEIIIVDKTGKEVLKTLINGNFQWNGKLLGRPLPTDTYWYLIKVSDGRILQGFVLLKNRN